MLRNQRGLSKERPGISKNAVGMLVYLVRREMGGVVEAVKLERFEGLQKTVREQLGVVAMEVAQGFRTAEGFTAERVADLGERQGL